MLKSGEQPPKRWLWFAGVGSPMDSKDSRMLDGILLGGWFVQNHKHCMVPGLILVWFVRNRRHCMASGLRFGWAEKPVCLATQVMLGPKIALVTVATRFGVCLHRTTVKNWLKATFTCDRREIVGIFYLRPLNARVWYILTASIGSGLVYFNCVHVQCLLHTPPPLM